MDYGFRTRPFVFDQLFEPAGFHPTDEAAAPELRLRVAALEAELALAQRDLEEAVAAARRDGTEAGLAQARGERGEALLAAADALHAAIEGVEGELATIADTAARDAGQVAFAAAEQLAARALVEVPAAAVDAAIGRALLQVARGQEIEVAVAPDLVEEVERLVQLRQSGDRRRLAITVVADPQLEAGDAHVHWDRGGLVLDADARHAAVREALASVLGG